MSRFPAVRPAPFIVLCAYCILPHVFGANDVNETAAAAAALGLWQGPCARVVSCPG